MTAEIPEVVFRFFASDPVGPMLTFDREVSDPPDLLRDPLEEFLASFGPDEVRAVQSDNTFRFFSDQSTAPCVSLSRPTSINVAHCTLGMRGRWVFERRSS